MIVKLDFSLADRRFNVVEKTIFRLVLNGVSDTQTIVNLLPIYSDSVIANAIKKLVNYQILKANLETRTLSASESIISLIEVCLNQSCVFSSSIETLEAGYKIANITDADTKQRILQILFPHINMGFLAKSIDFIVISEDEQNEQ